MGNEFEVNIRNDTFTSNLIELIGIGGEIKKEDLKKLNSSEYYLRNQISELINKKLIKKYSNDGIVGYRLTKRTKEYLLLKNKNRFEFYLKGNTETNKIRGDISRRIRLHKILNINIFMQRTNVKIFRDEKEKIFYDYKKITSSKEISYPSFYSSREVKELGDISICINSSVFVGLLMTPRNVYIVYNTENKLMKWNLSTEKKLFDFIKVHLTSKKIVSNNYTEKNIKGLCIGENIDTFSKMISMNIMNKKKSYFYVHEYFENIIFLENNERGETLLKFLCCKEKNNQLLNVLKKGYKERNDNYAIVNDAIDNDNKPILFNYYLDLVRLNKFKKGLFLQKQKGIIYCFDFQKKAILNYYNDLVEIKEIDFNKFKRSFLDEY